MADLIAFPVDALQVHISRTARWLRGRRPHTVAKNHQTERNRLYAALVCAGVASEQAHEQADAFAQAVADRYVDLVNAEQEQPACPVVYVGPAYSIRESSPKGGSAA